MVPGTRILVVDDNITNRKMLERVLLQRQLIPVLTASSAEALETLENAYAKNVFFSAILLDQEMPGRGGLEMAEMLRKSPRLSSLQIILMLAHPLSKAERFECARLGITRTLLKPIRRGALFDALCTTSGKPELERQTREDKVPVSELASARGEDNLVNQRLISRILEKMGHLVIVADDGKAVLRLMADYQI